jgi:hypothetical protein
MDKAEFMVELYKEQIAQGRHTESQRLEVTKFLAAGVAALASVMGGLKFSVYTIPISVAIIYLGFFGRRFTAIYVNRFEIHMKRARAFRKEADDLLADGRAAPVLEENKFDADYLLSSPWATMHNAIIVFGFLLLFLSLAATVARMYSDAAGARLDSLANVSALKSGERQE